MPETETASPDSVICSKCGVNPQAGSGKDKWCKDCRAKYQRDYQGTKEGRAEAKGFHRGVRAMRAHLADRFEAVQGNGSFSCPEIADIIRVSDAPEFEAED